MMLVTVDSGSLEEGWDWSTQVVYGWSASSRWWTVWCSMKASIDLARATTNQVMPMSPKPGNIRS